MPQILLNSPTGTTVDHPWRGIGGKGLVIPGGHDTLTDFTVTVTTAATRVQFTGSATPVHAVYVVADVGNAGQIVVGSSTVVAASGSQRGIVLFVGNPGVWIPVADLSSLWVDATSNGDKVCGVYFS